MSNDRHLDWEGCRNVRGDHPGYLAKGGWSALWACGIRTVRSLETDKLPLEQAAQTNRHIDVERHHPGLAHLRMGVEDGADTESMG